MEEISLHILDIAENCITAGATNIIIKVYENKKKNLLRIDIEDNGKGMDNEQLQKAVDPFFTSRTTRKVGMGLSLLKQAATAANGKMEIKSRYGKGTIVNAIFQLDHIDRQPLGNLADTLIALISRSPDIEIFFSYQKNGKKFIFDTKEVKKKIKGLAINTPTVLVFLKKFIEENIMLISKERKNATV